MNPISELKSLLASPKRIAITTHQKPDGDAMGSSLGWYHYLIGKGHSVKVVAPTDYPDFLKWLPGNDQVIVGPFDQDRANWTFDGADIIFCLDLNTLHRVGDFEKAVRDSNATKVMIDHHLDPEGFEDLNLSDETASSAAEIVYRIICELDGKEAITKPIAECVYTGIMTDTGSFRFTNTSPAVHRIAAHLIEIGIDVNRIYEEIFNTSTPERLKFIGYCLSNCLHILPEYNTAYIKIDKDIFKQFAIKAGDTEGLVNYALSIKGVNLAVLFTPRDDLIKLSFRSRGEVSARDFAQEFNGGGHFYASGGRSKLSMEKTEERFLELLEQNKAALAT